MAAAAAAAAIPVGLRRERARGDLNAAGRQAEVAARLLSHGAFRGWVTRYFNQYERLVTSAAASAPCRNILEQLTSSLKKLEQARDNVCLNAANMAYYDDQNQDNVDHYEQLKDQEWTRSDGVFQGLVREIGRYETGLAPPAPVARAPGPVKVADGLKPKQLSRDSTPVEVRIWIKRFKAYFRSSQMDNMLLSVQQEYFEACLEDVLVERLSDKYNETTPMLNDNVPPGTVTCIGLVLEEFLVLHPLYTRRLDFFRSNLSPGQAASEWASSLKRQGDEASIETLEADDIYVMRYLVAIPDPLLTELLKIEEPTRAKFDQLINQYEQGLVYRSSGNSAAVAAFGEKPKGARSKKPQKGRKQPVAGPGTAKSPIGQRMDQMRTAGQCTRCGSKQSPHSCDYDSLSCKKCGRTGHLASVCLGHLRQAAQSAPQQSPVPSQAFYQPPPPPPPSLISATPQSPGSFYEGSQFDQSEQPHSYSTKAANQS